jgi:zinc protease
MNSKKITTTLLASTLLLANVTAQTKKAAPKAPVTTQGALAGTLASVSGVKFIEEVKKSNTLGTIAYKKYMLDNGLTIIVHEDHSDPICHVDVTYHVGSNREQIGRSGFAHFFEHMMFQGSEHVADEEHFKIVSEAGGTLNGTTNKDRTNYFETMPNNQLETGLFLESDRMGYLLNAVTQQKFEVQRATVKNERGQNYDNRPYGLIGEKTNRALYPYGHPYNWSTIGDLVDLDRVNVDDLKQFFMRWYGPNNATLTVGGDVSTEQVLVLAKKYFGNIPRGVEVKNLAKQPAVLDATRYISYEDKVRFPQLNMTFPTVETYNPDMYALDALGQILGQSETSPLYQKFVKTQQAMNAFSYGSNEEIAGTFDIIVRAKPDMPLADYEKQVRALLAEFDAKGVTDEDVNRFKASTEANYIKELASVSGKASILAASQTFTGNPNQLVKDMAAYNAITKDDVMRVFRKYILNKPCVVTSCVPVGKTNLIAAANNYTPKVTNPADADMSEYNGLKYNRPIDNFDRSKKPKAGAAPFVQVPNYTQVKAANGLKVISSTNDEIPTITMQLYVDCGHRMEAKNKAGIANLLSDMLNETTEQLSAEDKAAQLEALGASVSAYVNGESVIFNIESPTKNIAATLKIAEQVILHPKFDAEDFDRIKNQTLEGIANQSTQAPVIANNVMAKLLYGSNSVMGLPVAGTKETVSNLTLSDVKNYYETNFKPNIATLVVTGNFNAADITKNTTFLTTTWQGIAKDKPEITKAAQGEGKKIYLVDKEKAPQSEIRIGYLSQPFDATGEYFKSRIMNYTLGGAFNSRINLNLREKRGFTYGARAGFSGSKYVGPYTAQAGVKGENTDSSIVEFMREIKEFADNGITDEELSFTKNAMTQADALKYETALQKAGFLKLISDYNLSKNYVNDQAKILNTITKAEINAIAKKQLPYNNMIIVTVGDKKANLEKLQKLGYEIIELDVNGNSLNAPKDGSRKEGY